MNGMAAPPPPPPLPPMQLAPPGPSASASGHAPKPHASSSSAAAHAKAKEDAKRREREKAAEKQRASQQVVALPAVTDNRLRRDTPFLATLRFKNDLPEIPGDPKLLVIPADPTRLSAFSLTSLEREPKRDLVLPADLGIPISLLNVERYAVPAGDEPQTLDPEDEALLGAPDERAAMSAVSRDAIAVRPRPRQLKNSEVSWLMRTTYIAQDSDAVRKQGINEKLAKSIQDGTTAQQADENEDASREAQIAAIEAAFEAAQKPPVHHKNPALKAVEILPVFPDFQCWPNKYIQAHFDYDPTEDVEALVKLPAPIRRKVAARSMLKGFRMDQVSSAAQQERQQAEGGEKDSGRFMALVVPDRISDSLAAEASGSAPVEDSAEVDPSELEGDYSWSKEYQYTLTRRDEAVERQEYIIRFRDGVAAYCEINGKMDLKKRKDGAQESMAARPAKVVVRRRELTEAEEAQRDNTMRRLLEGHVSDEEEEEVEDA